jgi:hypothetical protein
MLTIVFYLTNGEAAKLRGREIVAQGKGNYARVYDVSSWEGNPDKCDSVEIMEDVPPWQRKRITDVYGEPQEQLIDEQHPEPSETITVDPNAKKNTKTAKHRGGGRWFVMDGEAVISGPHEKAEAQRLAELPHENVSD